MTEMKETSKIWNHVSPKSKETIRSRCIFRPAEITGNIASCEPALTTAWEPKQLLHCVNIAGFCVRNCTELDLISRDVGRLTCDGWQGIIDDSGKQVNSTSIRCCCCCCDAWWPWLPRRRRGLLAASIRLNWWLWDDAKRDTGWVTGCGEETSIS